MPILPGFVPPLFETETNPIRFERVCQSLYQAAEGVTVVPTSYNYDQGRDGRTIGVRREQPYAVLCATLSVELDDKVHTDIARLLQTTSLEALIYCTARKITERECDRIENLIREEFPAIELVRVLSQAQLVALGLDHEPVLLQYYPGEIANLQHTLQAQAGGAAAGLYGLRLALATSTGESADELRHALLARLILDILIERGAVGLNGIAAALASRLHLPRPPSLEYVRGALQQLAGRGLAVVAEQVWTASEEGRNHLGHVEESAAKLLEGRTLVRTALTELTGFALPDDMFERLWNRFQTAMADAFHEHGLDIVESIRGIVEGGNQPVSTTFRDLLLGIARRATEHLTSPEQRDEFSQAIIDMFSERGTPAVEWLSEICSVYVMMCSLGLEPHSARQIGGLLSAIHMVPDSDIVLSLLCQGEANHAEVDRIVRGWQALGGSIVVVTPVLTEVAHHAWIADRDYAATSSIFPRLDEVAAERQISNAFVKSFWRLEGGRANGRRWGSYIREYRGRTDHDYANIALLLREEYRIDRVPDYINFDSPPAEGTLEARLLNFILNSIAADRRVEREELDHRIVDKARRDAKLLANLAEMRRVTRDRDGSTALVVSSARVLRLAAVRFREELEDPEAVISLSAVATLLTLTPGVQFGMGSLRSVLFDTGLSRMLSPLQRLANRAIAASELYELPHARRVTLARRLREGMLSDARRRVRPVAEIEEELLSGRHDEDVARTIHRALDRMSVEPRVGELMRRQQEEIERLQHEVQRLRRTETDDEAESSE